jgi:4-alpha-glucanotransferase
LQGWFEGLPEEVREAIFRVLGRNGDAGMPGALIEAALDSPAMLAMLPMQDVLALGPGHRMNTPGTTLGNWNWRFSWTDIPEGTAETFRALIERSGRLASAPDPLWRLPAE